MDSVPFSENSGNQSLTLGARKRFNRHRSGVFTLRLKCIREPRSLKVLNLSLLGLTAVLKHVANSRKTRAGGSVPLHLLHSASWSRGLCSTVYIANWGQEGIVLAAQVAVVAWGFESGVRIAS